MMTTACVRNARERLVRVMCEVLRCVITLLLDPAPEERPDKTQAVREREEFLPDLHHQIESSPHTPAEESRPCTPAANIRQATRHRHLRVYLTSLSAALGGARRKPVHLQPRRVHPWLSFLSTVRVQRELCK